MKAMDLRAAGLSDKPEDWTEKSADLEAVERLIAFRRACGADGYEAGVLNTLESVLAEVWRLREALAPFAEAAMALDDYRGEQPDRLVQMHVNAADCKRAKEVLG